MAAGTVSLAEELQSLVPAVQPSPWPGYEWVEGFGVMAMPFTSGHVLVLRAFPRNSFVPYKSVWHRTPDGTWTIFVDGAPAEKACPRYFGAAAEESSSARIDLTWTGPMDLEVTVEPLELRWTMSLTEPAYLRALNAASSRLPEVAWRSPVLLRGMELMASVVLGMGDVELAGKVPSGHWATLTPRRMYFVRSAHAELAGLDWDHLSRRPRRRRSVQHACQANQPLPLEGLSSSPARLSETAADEPNNSLRAQRRRQHRLSGGGRWPTRPCAGPWLGQPG